MIKEHSIKRAFKAALKGALQRAIERLLRKTQGDFKNHLKGIPLEDEPCPIGTC